ncbi:hypothetical protein FWD07_00475 [Candidatus Saccharibacteria bacterium]|nr:hypothetical protein [Candidatus Saccharibacteria bacterium]
MRSSNNSARGSAAWWRKQEGEALFPEIEWNRPEQKSLAGKMAVIGGNGLGFNAVSMGFAAAERIGVGEVRVLMPDVLKKKVPGGAGMIFAGSNGSGGFGKEALSEMRAVGTWADVSVLVGDLGKNSETAVVVEEFLDLTGQVVVTRDTVDLVMDAAGKLVEREGTVLVLTMGQVQKLFRAVYYPKMVTFSMQLVNLVEVLHKFTVTYPVGVMTFHQGNLMAAKSGEVVTMKIEETRWSPLTLWSGEVTVRIAAYWAWNPENVMGAIVTGWREYDILRL